MSNFTQRKVFLLLTSIIFSGYLAAQTTLTLQYDAVGNRIRATTPCQLEQETRPSGSFFRRLELFPNPASTFVNLEFELRRPGSLQLDLVSILGTREFVLEDSDIEAEHFRYRFSVAHLPPGVYYVRLFIANEPTYLPLVVSRE